MHTNLLFLPLYLVFTSTISENVQEKYRQMPITTRQTSSSLLPLTFNPLPLGSIKPLGWFQDQLELMADGLAGHEHDFYTYVKLSSWLGSDREYSGLREGFPYWFNGLVPLAYGLDNERLKSQVHSSAQYVLNHQARDGWLGPEKGFDRNLWARFPFCLGLIQLAEANTTWTRPVINALHGFVRLMHTMLSNGGEGYLHQPGDQFPFGKTMWGRVRYADMMITLQWLHENAPHVNKDILIESMQMLQDGSIDWADWYREDTYIKQDYSTLPGSVIGPFYPYSHGVNVGQGLKAAAVTRRFTHNDSLLQTVSNGVTWTFQYHGAASGTVLADERLEGLNPYTGSELCTAVETMYSLSYLYQAIGTNEFADRAELTAYNALPVMMTSDWWGHQYVAQPNQPFAKVLSSTPFSNVNKWATIFGLEPNYPCCTVNHPQGYPKFLSGSFVKVGTNGLAHVLLSPGVASTTLDAGSVSVRCDTNYPFGDKLKYTITSTGPFDFYIRIPGWAIKSDSYVQVRGSKDSRTQIHPDGKTGLHKVRVSDTPLLITVSLDSTIVIEQRANDAIAVRKGALLYALDVGFAESSKRPRAYGSHRRFSAGYAPPQSRDWTFKPTKSWNVAIDPSTLKFHSNGTNYAQLANPIFAPNAPPPYITAKACEIKWPLYKSVPGKPPPIRGRKCQGKTFEAKLVPYGSSKVHMAELPVIDLSSRSTREDL